MEVDDDQRHSIGPAGAALAVVIAAIVITVSGGDDDKSNTTPRTQTGSATQTKNTDTSATQTEPAPKPVVTKVRVVNAKPVGGITKIEVEKGERVRFSVTSDVADEVDVHGDDHIKDVPAGGTVKFSFPATIAGGFEIELEHREEQIASLRVSP